MFLFTKVVIGVFLALVLFVLFIAAVLVESDERAGQAT